MRRLAALLLPALLLASLPVAARADLAGLRVAGPPGAWNASRAFNVEWDEFAPSGVSYHFINAPWDPGTYWRDTRTAMELVIPVPPAATLPPPGEYIVEIRVWNGDPASPPGPPSYLGLRYDPSVPGPPRVTAPSGWVDSHSQVPIAIEPRSRLPPSAIAGYSFAVSAEPGKSPCAAASFCVAADFTVPGGPGPREIAIGPLPEGIAYLNVVTVSGAGVVSPVASVPLRVDASPPTIRFDGIPSGWVNHPVTVGAIADDDGSGTAATGSGGSFTALAIDGGTPTVALGGAVAATVRGDGPHRITAWARDRLGNESGARATAPATVRIDETPPQAAFAAGQRPEDPELLEATVTDPLSGASGERGSIGVRPAGTSQAFQPLATAVTATGLRARWSSDDYPPGNYEFRATGFDAAGNKTLSERRAGGAAMVLRNPIKTPTAIDSGFGGARLVWQRCHRIDGERRRCRRETVTDFEARPAARTVAYGRPLRFGGVLHTASGAPLVGSAVEIVETFAAGADVAQRRTTVASRGDGRFEALLAPGPSRRVEAFFPGSRTLTRSVGRRVTMAVRAGVRFRASTNAAKIGGKPVIFSGRLRAGEATIRRTGRPIQLEFRVPGGEWSEFRTVQTDRHGRFRYPYSFSDDDSRGIRFQFRAVSPDQADFPYRPAASAPVAVTGF